MLALALLAFAGGSPAQEHPAPGPDGTWVVEERVSLLSSAPASCIALEAENGAATIVLPLQEIEELAARDADRPDIIHVVLVDGPPTKPMLYPRSARALLKLVQPERDVRGCRRVQLDRAPSIVNGLIGGLLEEGHAAVYTHHLNLAEPALVVRHVTSKIFGYDVLVLLDGTLVLHCPLWIS